MPTLVLNDGREFVFPLLMVDVVDDKVDLSSYRFLGTCFFVTKCGDAVTAGHVVPSPQDIPTGKRLVAAVQRDGKLEICWITHAASWEGCDLALVHVNLPDTRYLSVVEGDVLAGMDLQLIGIPSHEVAGAGKEMRLLKGHVTFARSDRLELNIAVPAGMSGSPVFAGTNVVGWATGYVRSEEILESREEVVRVAADSEQIEISTVSHVIYYGTAVAFSRLRGQSSPIFEGMTLMQFIQARNAA
ncbi:MAG TPA: serine protease [Paraburkholderia sp.]